MMKNGTTRIIWILMAFFSMNAAADESRIIINPDYGKEDLQSVEFNGAQIQYLSKGQGEPIILIHGALSDYRYWQETIEELSKSYQVIAYSLRHHFPNESQGDLSDYTMDDHVSDLTGLIEFLELPGVHLVGHSLGGNIATLAAFKRPDLIKSIVLEEGGFISNPGAAALQAEGAAIVALMEVPELVAQGNYEEIAKRFIELVVGQGSFQGLAEAEKQFYLDNVKTLITPHQLDTTPLTCDQLSAVDAPVLMIRGDSTVRFLKLFVDAAHECLAMGSVTIEGAGHDVHSAKPDEFNNALLNFLK